MSSTTDHVVEGILKYSLIPYAKSHNIEIRELIKRLSEYHESLNKKNNNIEIESKKRGRPKGKKNNIEENDKSNKTKRPRGRPKGSTTKKLNILTFNND